MDRIDYTNHLYHNHEKHCDDVNKNEGYCYENSELLGEQEAHDSAEGGPENVANVNNGPMIINEQKFKEVKYIVF